MTLPELFLIALGLSMDAFAIALCKGLSVSPATLKRAVCAGVYFGGFQALMPLMGYLLGTRFQAVIISIDHWIAFVLLSFIGLGMIRESFAPHAPLDASFAPRAMLPLALATSIDALAMGVNFAFLRVDILRAVGLIGGITFALSSLGLRMGSLFGARFKGKAELFGGVVLMLMGCRILLEHLTTGA